jgi:nicotinamide-nucleotide amidase
LGKTLNTHLSTLAHALFPLGLRIQRQTTVPDGLSIGDALREAIPRADVIMVTGGLGPTSDDVTRETVSEVIQAPLVFNPSVWQAIVSFFSQRNRPVPENNRKQAFVPQGAEVLPNRNGTAPGLWIRSFLEGKERLFVLLPGPPAELQPMLCDEVIPRLKEWAKSPVLHEATWSVVGMGESAVAQQVESFLQELWDCEYGYCARNGQVDIRFISRCEKRIEEAEKFFKEKFGIRIFRSDGKPLESLVIAEANAKRIFIATAESCTGGLIAHRLTNVDGASRVFRGGWVPYSDVLKERMLGVDRSLIEEHSSVSAAVAAAMAEGALRFSQADLSVATTGYAGPSGGDQHNPVGTVFIAWSQKGMQTDCERLFLPMERESFKQRVAQIAIDGLRMRIENFYSFLSSPGLTTKSSK